MWGKVLASAAVAGSLLLAGCGGDSSDKAPAVSKAKGEAYFVDNAVIGLRYRCGADGSIELTGAQGLLRCNVGQKVSFYIGDIFLGSSTMGSGVGFITPLTLATTGETVDENMVINLARLLISLDADGNLENGIQIDEASHVNTGLVLDFSLDTESFESAVGPVLVALTQALSEGPFGLVDAGDAEEHLLMGLYAANAGFYEGTIDRGEGVSSYLAFIATREGAVYGVNRDAVGAYAIAGFDEEEGPYNPVSDANSGFKIDGETGATQFLDAGFNGGKSAGEMLESSSPSFTAKRKMVFEPMMDWGMVEALDSLTPLAIDLTGNEDIFIIDFEELLGGTLYTFWGPEGVPFSENLEMDPPSYTFYNFAEAVSTKDGVIRLLAMSGNGYLVDLTADFNGEVPVITTKWRHLHEGRSGSTSEYTANYDLGMEEPMLLTSKGQKSRDPSTRTSRTSGKF